jgi:hypothetical protein
VLKTPKTEKVTVGELLDANLERADAKKLASRKGIRDRTKTLTKLLGSVRTVEFRPGHVDAYKKARRALLNDKGKRRVSDTSIRHELGILNRAFSYAVERGALRFAPFIEKPTEDNVREKEIPLEKVPAILKAISCPDVRGLRRMALSDRDPAEGCEIPALGQARFEVVGAAGFKRKGRQMR